MSVERQSDVGEDLDQRILREQKAGLSPKAQRRWPVWTRFIPTLSIALLGVACEPAASAETKPVTEIPQATPTVEPILSETVVPSETEETSWTMAEGKLPLYIDWLVEQSPGEKDEDSLRELFGQIYKSVEPADKQPSAVIKVYHTESTPEGLKIKDTFSWAYLIENEQGELAYWVVPDEIKINKETAKAGYDPREDKIVYRREKDLQRVATYDIEASLLNPQGLHRFQTTGKVEEIIFIWYGSTEGGGGESETTALLFPLVFNKGEKISTLSFLTPEGGAQIEIPQRYLAPYTSLDELTAIPDPTEPSIYVIYAKDKVIGEVDIEEGKYTPEFRRENVYKQ